MQRLALHFDLDVTEPLAKERPNEWENTAHATK